MKLQKSEHIFWLNTSWVQVASRTAYCLVAEKPKEKEHRIHLKVQDCSLNWNRLITSACYYFCHHDKNPPIKGNLREKGFILTYNWRRNSPLVLRRKQTIKPYSQPPVTHFLGWDSMSQRIHNIPKSVPQAGDQVLTPISLWWTIHT